MNELLVLFDANQCPVYGLQVPVPSNIQSGQPTSVVSAYLADNTVQQTVLVPQGAAYCVIGSTGDYALAPIPFTLPVSTGVTYNVPYTINFPSAFDVQPGQNLYVRTPVVTGALLTFSFYKRKG